MRFGSLFLSLGASVALAGVMASSAWADQRLWIGGYNSGVANYGFDIASGKTTNDKTIITPTENASWFAFDTTTHLFFAVNEQGSSKPTPLGEVSSFRLNDPMQPMLHLSTQQTMGNEPTFLSLSPDHRYVYVANYAVDPNPGGSFVILPIGQDGKLGPIVQKFTWPASHVDPKRQVSSHAHQTIVSPDGKYVFECDLGGDRVYSYRYHSENAQQPLEHVQTYSAPAGSGPRHLAFTADGKHAYLTLEMAASMVVLDLAADGSFAQRQVIKLDPFALHGGQGAAGAIGTSEDGKFLYVTNRGNVNEVLVFSIDQVTGAPTFVQAVSAKGREPRVFRITPDGKHFLVANQFSNHVVFFERDPQTGEIGKVVEKLRIKAPSMLYFPTNG